MQSFDAKPFSPFPSGSGKTQKTGGGDGEGGGSAGEETVTLSSSPLRPLPRHTAPGRLGELSGGYKGSRGLGVQGPPGSSRVSKRREQTHF